MKKHIHGLLEKKEDGLSIKWDLLADLFANAVNNEGQSKKESKDDYNISTSSYVPRVFLKVYSCDKECSLEEAESGFIKKMVGALDILTEWYGYSEYTIEGYSVENFTIGGHDLEKEFESLVGKYVHFLIEIKD